ncbi:G patch domain-containing protein 4 [Electrophorus electricus]|uniref:G patch domain-containing protein 4 n=1 Tax=Electrophorus electricus TaxID=8005 RepID=A0A4W4GKC0_ELEEL|nr:G patch domain-containing protein 4 [Electrophorus electricus]
MAEVVQEKSGGLSFAERQLVRHGWERGKGLGRDESGISEAIKVKVKCDKGGVGHKESEQFTFHWWDHVFNKASANLAVESGQDGVLVRKIEGTEARTISNKKPRKATSNKSVLYGCFVKSATLLSGQEQPECESSCSEDRSCSEDEENLDLSSTAKLSDAELMKACGGRTAHKGARHGLTMRAKLARLEQQEQEFMAKYGMKTSGSPPRTGAATPTPLPSLAPNHGPAGKTKRKKARKNKEQGSSEPPERGSHLSPPHHDDEVSKKQKKRSKQNAAPDSADVPGALVDNKEMPYTKLKGKKRRKHLEKITEPGDGKDGYSSLVLDEDHTWSTQQNKRITAAKPHGVAADHLEGAGVLKKEREKKHFEQMAEEALKENSLVVSECYVQAQQEEGSVALQPAHGIVSRKKKRKSCKPKKLEPLATELGTLHSWEASSNEASNKIENVETAACGTEKSDRRKRKRGRGGEQ